MNNDYRKRILRAVPDSKKRREGAPFWTGRRLDILVVMGCALVLILVQKFL